MGSNADPGYTGKGNSNYRSLLFHREVHSGNALLAVFADLYCADVSNCFLLKTPAFFSGHLKRCLCDFGHVRIVLPSGLFVFQRQFTKPNSQYSSCSI